MNELRQQCATLLLRTVTQPFQYPGSFTLLSSQIDDLSATLSIAINSCDSLSLSARPMIPSST